jgi:ribosomal protein S1/(E)-4-hydroxy-3-methyl-but-2-enyl pyrophosphate reductase
MAAELRLAKSAGFCFGVRRSAGMAEELLSEGPCYALGELIHNEDVMRRLTEKGLRVIASPEELPAGERVLIRAHGASRAEYQALAAGNARICDATCPNVERIHQIVRQASEQGRTVLVIGDREHPEVRAILGWCGEAVVVSGAAELALWLARDTLNPTKPLTVVVQTTQTADNMTECNKFIKNVCTNAEVFDTICSATSTRQEEAKKLASECDAMVVIGGKHSANSLHLYKLCRERCANTQFVANAAELDTALLRRATIIGVTAGASAPEWIIKEVQETMIDENVINENPELDAPVKENECVCEEAAPVAEEVPAVEKSFDEMLEDSLKSVYNGDTVNGVVVAITPTEISVDLGTKYSGFIPTSEFDGAEGKVEDLFHVGDTIEAIVVRVNDVEGTAQLSKKRLDSVKSWGDIEAAQEDGTVVEGTVTEINKGGVVVTIKGNRVFVPASQSGMPKDADMNELLKQKVRLKITEVNRARRRVVGSIRAVSQRERREKSEAVWNEIENGKLYKGIVKSLTSYGAFVDIGGVDGMVHVSELSWNRVKNPADVVGVGDELEVYVLSFDKDNHRISLGCKKAEDNPWNKFVTNFSVGDVATVKIVKLMPFGAFAEVMPGVDGLIHISQIANRRIAQPGEVLTVGDEVDAKITAIDNDRQKISLSIRALSEPEPARHQDEEQAAPASREDALVYEVGVDGEAKGNVPMDAGNDQD